MGNKRIDIDTVPVYHEKFKTIIDRIRGLLKDYQHELKVTQNESGGTTSSVEVTIVLKS